MIQMQSILLVADNSGVKRVMCVKVLGGSHKYFAGIGDFIKVSVKDVLPNVKIKKGEVMDAIIVRTKKGVTRKDGSSIKFDNNAVVLLNTKGEPVGTRIFGPITNELRSDEKLKLSSLALEIL